MSRPQSITSEQILKLEFTVPNRSPTHVTISVRPNDDPDRIGQHLLFPEDNTDDFIGYPICQAKISSPESIGYAAYYGWIQMVAEDSGAFEMDPLPITADLNTPFCFFGAEPQLFDCPSRPKEIQNLDWTAVSFLTYIKDTVLTRHVRPIFAFEWGFRIVDGAVRVKHLQPCNVDQAWEQQRGLLESKFEGWQFGRLDEGVNLRNHSDGDS
ncbi:hypothetical protein LTR56_011412 [Elasticomyces elasticus]|nr:hypothetical protein LTR56_011412 [Elasticomyces elasticus]KAK3655994.1 hypothetical protein LTR22_010003 [Elasticomyces elasticus]KAK4921493.1 hypothetical protein LTR49_011147 [Elasticomyces elasticus]KAK5760036.1 hypothetical protein LTS12_009767 [Elasticomyces elasticus]